MGGICYNKMQEEYETFLLEICCLCTVPYRGI